MFAPLFLGVLLSVHQAPKVSLDLRGVRMENAAPIIAKSLGMNWLDVGATLKNEVVLVRAKDVDPEILKAKIAKVLNGAWERQNDGWALIQSPEQKSAERKIYDKERYKFFSGIVDRAKKKLAGLKPFDEENCKQILKDLKVLSTTKSSREDFGNKIWRRISKIDEQSPMSRFANRAAMRITPEVWLKLTEQNPRVVFCTRPNSMQQDFPIRIDDLIGMAMEEQSQWSSFASGEPLQGPSAGPDDESGNYSLGNLNDHRAPFKSTDFYMVSMTIELASQSIEFNAYDAKGKSTFSTSVNAYGDDELGVDFDYKTEIEKLKKRIVKVTGEAAEYLDLVSPMSQFGGRREKKKAISPALLAKLLQPEKIDPLSISAPDIYLPSIETPNVVMVMNDFQRVARFVEFKDERFMRFSPANIEDKDGWFLLSSPNPIAGRKAMPDRQKLGNMLRFMNANKRPLTIEEQASFALQLPWEVDYSWAYKSHLEALDTTSIESYNGKAALRIYGSLTSGQVNQAKKGGVPLGSLSNEAKIEIFRSLFYSQKYESRVEMDWGGQQEMTPEQSKNFQELQNLMYGGIYEEKTFVLPKGLTNELLLTIEDSTTSTLYCGRPDSPDGEMYGGEGRAMSASGLGDYLFKCTNPQRYRWEVQQPYMKVDETNIRLASQRRMTMKLKLSKLMFISWSLSQTLITDPTVYTSKTLPQILLDEVKKGYAQAEKNDKEYGQYYGARPAKGTNPPPQ